MEEGMPRKLTSRSSVENLRKEAKRWLKALRANDEAAHARLRRALPNVGADPSLRDVQHALAIEHGMSGWTELTTRVGVGSLDDESLEALTSLLDAAGLGDVARVTEILDTYPELVSERGFLRGNTGRRTALHYAVGGSHVDVVRLLLDRGADPNVRDDGDNAIPLCFACEKDDFEIIRLLVEHGSDVNSTGDMHTMDVIGWATVFGGARPEIVEYLLSHSARHNIWSAVTMGDVAAIRAIVRADRSRLDATMDDANHRRHPLHLAIVKRRPESLAELLALGADPETRDAAKLTPLDQASLNAETEMARTLKTAGAALTLPAAMTLGRDEDFERLLRRDPDALKPGHAWGTLIVRAAEQAPGGVIDTLIHAGADVDAVDDVSTAVDGTIGYTPLHAAAFRGNRDAVVALLSHGANVRKRDSKYCGTPAGWANYAKHPDVRDLILAGDIDVFDAIDFAPQRIREILRREPEALERPMGEMVDVALQAYDWIKPWWTPLAYAVARQNVVAARTLLDLGADPTVRNDDGVGLATLVEQSDDEAMKATFAEKR
jgi:ankyrin repeat protein